MNSSRLPVAAAVAASLAFAASSWAASVTDLNGTPGTADWSTLNTSTGTAEISTDQPRSGNGSVKLATTNKNKAAVTYGGNRFGGPNLGTFGDLLDGGSLGFEIYRDSASTTTDHLAIAYEISFSNRSILKWEAVYNGFPVAGPTLAEDVWNGFTFNADNGKFFQFGPVSPTANGNTTNGGQVNQTLRDWLGDSFNGSDFEESTQITGISMQAGSGWPDTFVGYVDNVFIDFGPGGSSISANFEATAVPSPAAAGGGLALFGMLLNRRRRVS